MTSDAGALRAAYRRFLPSRWRLLVRDLPARIRDVVPDLLEKLGDGLPALPPARLRRSVALTSSRQSFLAVGRSSCDDILAVCLRLGVSVESHRRFLDFGCGCGRVARHLPRALPGIDLWGCDVNVDAVAWMSRHLDGTFLAIDPAPPTAFPDSHFDVICAISVFTHLDEDAQHAWLNELHRLLRPGGFLLASSHAPSLTWTLPHLNPEQLDSLREKGFLFVAGQGDFNDDASFHSREYLLSTWGRLFGLRLFLNHGLTGYQDLHAWEKW